MNLTKILGIAGALLVSALVGGTLINAALATEDEKDADSGTGARYCETFRERLANELGITIDRLTEAGKAAAIETIDAAVQAGDLDGDRAERLRERVQAFDGTCDGLGFGMARGIGNAFGHPGHHGRGAGVGVLRLAADELGITTFELREQLAELGSLQAVAEARDLDYAALTVTILADVEERLDEAVADGLDQERADTMLEHISAWLADGGQLDELGGAGLGPDGGGRGGPHDGQRERHGPNHPGGWGHGRGQGG